MVDDQVKAIELAVCPFCGGAMVECNDEDGHYWVHPGRQGMSRANCWLADAWVSDQEEGEGSIGEWNTRAVSISRAVPPDGSIEALISSITDDPFQPMFRDEVIGLIRSAVSISRASQGSRVGTEDDVKRVTDALEPKCRGFGHGNMPRAIAEEFARAAIAALSPPATPQAPEDVRSYDAEIFEVFVWALRRWQTKMTPEELAKSLVEAPAMKDLLAGGVRYLATPVTVTMEEVEALTADFLGRYHKTRMLNTNVANFLKDALRRILGDRIQIAGEPK